MVTPQGEASIADVLAKLDVGSSVAEFDANLQRYFLETETFRALVDRKKDIVAGDKGTGKTAIFRILKDRYRSYPELQFVEVVSGFNTEGPPVFTRLLETEVLDELSYVGIWKSYILALAGNYMLGLADGARSDDLDALDAILRASGLRSLDDTPNTVFSQLANRVKRLLTPTAATASVATTESGVPVWSARLEFDSAQDAADYSDLARHEEALGLLDRVVATWDVELWIALDRLDEAFPARPDLERAALRALLRTFLDLQSLQSVKLKLFVRRDLFARVTEGGFVNLTHINARRIDIEWDEGDLYQLLYERIHDRRDFTEAAGITDADADTTFAMVFPDQVDQGGGKPKTWRWMLSRVSDGNGVAPPRNLIDLVAKAKEAQLRAENRSPRSMHEAPPLIGSDSLKRGLESLSALRVEDTLLAEAGDLGEYVERFRGGKAEHNEASIGALLQSPEEDLIKRLVRLGFLERIGSSYKIPMLYRSGLSVTQGKAFD